MPGPAAATNAMSLLGLYSCLGLIGTGFAHPKRKPPGTKKIKLNGTKILPTGSMCGIGFSVRRPCNLAVESPK